jgi:hypothetical protein
MTKLLFVVFSIGLALFASSAQKINAAIVPAVKASFSKKYSDIISVWHKEGMDYEG